MLSRLPPMTRDRFVRMADGLFIGLMALAWAIDFSGGFRLGRDWYRLSLRNPTHVLVAAAVVFVARHLAQRRPSLRDRIRDSRWLQQASAAATLRLDAVPLREWLAALVVMSAATAALLHDQLWMLDGVPDRGDPLFSMWRLGWVAHQVRIDPTHLFDANIFHPAAGTLAYSDATILPGLIVAPWLWAGVPLSMAHGILYLASFVTAGLTMFVLARATTGRLVPSLAAGVLFAFYPYRFSTYSHLEMQGVALMPLALLSLLRTLERGRIRDALWLGVSIGCIALWSLYLGAYLTIGLLALVGGVWLTGSFAFRARGRALVLAAFAAAAIVGPYSVPYWRAHAALGDRSRDELRVFSAEPSDYLAPNGNNALYGGRQTTFVNAERALFPGAVPLALGFVAVLPPAAPLAVATGVGILVAMDATRGADGLLFSLLNDLAPPFRAFRVPARFGMVVGLFLCLLSAIGLATVEALGHARRSVRVVYVVVLATAAFELRPQLQLAPAPSAPTVYRALDADPGAPLVDLPIPTDDSEYLAEPTYVYYSTFHWHPLVNGYSGFAPSWYGALQAASRDMPSDESLAALRQTGARYFVLHRAYYPADRYRILTAALDQRRDVALVTIESSSEGERRLYRFTTRTSR